MKSYCVVTYDRNGSPLEAFGPFTKEEAQKFVDDEVESTLDEDDDEEFEQEVRDLFHILPISDLSKYYEDDFTPDDLILPYW